MKIKTKNRSIKIDKYYLDFNVYENKEFRYGFCVPRNKLKHNIFIAFLLCLIKPIDFIIDKQIMEEL